MHSSTRIPRLLLTSDDGFESIGLKILADIAKGFSDEVWIIAPEHDQSGTGQSVTLNQPLRCWKRQDRCWAVSGTPGDCVALALFHFMAEAKPTLILSGINSGANLGDEINLSGTLGASLMGLMFGIPSVAVSQAFTTTRKDIKWETSRAVVPKVLSYLLKVGWSKEACLSINIPDLLAENITRLSWANQSHNNVSGFQINEQEHRDKLYWLKLMRQVPPGDSTDYTILKRGEVAVTALRIDRNLQVPRPSICFDELD